MSNLVALIRRDQRTRTMAIGAGLGLVLLLLTQFAFPGAQRGTRGVPAAVLFNGLITGLSVSVFAVSLVLIYRTMRFVNFALGPIGSIGLALVARFLVFTPVPFPIVIALAIVMCSIGGLLIGIFLLRFFKSSRLFLTVASVVAAGALGFLSGFIDRLPFFPSPAQRTSEQTQCLERVVQCKFPFQGFKFHIGSFPTNFGFRHLFSLELAILGLVAVAVFLRWTKAGVAVRAMAQNPERASLLGISVGSLSLVIWMFAGMLDGVGVLSAVAGGADIGGGANLFSALLIPLAAAAVARFKNIPTAVYTAVLLGVLRASWTYSLPRHNGLLDALMFAIICAALLSQGKAMARSEVGAQVSWSGTDEPRPVPKELNAIRGLVIARIGFIVVGVALLGLFPFLVPGRRLLAGVIFIHAIAVLSLVVLTGWAGQVSLGQFGIVAVGSVVGGALTSKAGVPFWFAVPMAIVICAAISVVVGLPALRIRGLFLLVTTFAFAVGIYSVLFDRRYFGWLLPESVDRPTLFFFNFEDETSMYFLSLAALVVAILVVVNLRKSRVGRVLIGLRESEANVQSFGISPAAAKLLAYAIAGALAGFAGAVFAHQQRGIAQASFVPDQSVQVFIEAVIGGVSSPGGALLGTAYLRTVTDLLRNNEIVLSLFQGFAPLAILFIAPGGFISLVNSMRDSILRVVAQRRQIVVPSLFADYDPDVIAGQLIPLAEPQTGAGLNALPHDRRFTKESVLYKGKGVRIVDRLKGVSSGKEAEAFGAAAKAALDAEYEQALVAAAVADVEGESN